MFILMLAHDYGNATNQFYAGTVFSANGLEVEGRTLTIVGFGASGQQLARRAKAFGMKINAIDVRPIEQEVLNEIEPDFLGGPQDLDAAIEDCDFLSVHLHLTEETKHIINKKRIALLKPTSYVINVARVGLIDEDALSDALKDKKLELEVGSGNGDFLIHHTTNTKVFVIATELKLNRCQKIAKKIPDHIKLIDLSADFRLKDYKLYKKWYGINHNCKELIKKSIYAITEFSRNILSNHSIISCPGCYPTSVQIPLVPFCLLYTSDAADE